MHYDARHCKFYCMINILFLGEIVGRPGIQSLKAGLSDLKKEYNVDFTMINCEGMTNGFGIGRQHSLQLGKMGIDLSTGGEKLFFKIDMVEQMGKSSYVLRPYNLPPACPGKGMKFVTIKDRKFLIANLIGNSGFSRVTGANALMTADHLAQKAEENGAILILTFHASTTAETSTLWHYMKTRAAAVIGTHTKVLTADEKVGEDGCAYITDTGRVGSFYSVGGFDPEIEIEKFKGAIPMRSRECWDGGVLQGVVVSIDEITGRAVKIERINKSVKIKKPEERA